MPHDLQNELLTQINMEQKKGKRAGVCVYRESVTKYLMKKIP